MDKPLSVIDLCHKKVFRISHCLGCSETAQTPREAIVACIAAVCSPRAARIDGGSDGAGVLRDVKSVGERPSAARAWIPEEVARLDGGWLARLVAFVHEEEISSYQEKHNDNQREQ